MFVVFLCLESFLSLLFSWFVHYCCSVKGCFIFAFFGLIHVFTRPFLVFVFRHERATFSVERKRKNLMLSLAAVQNGSVLHDNKVFSERI